MIGLRGAAWTLLIAAIGLGIRTQAVPAREAMTSGPYTILAADFHVHSFPGDGGLPPWDIAVEAGRRRLDVVALTNHNTMASWSVARLVAPELFVPRAREVMLLPGVELTSAGYHMTAVGVSAVIPWHQPPATAAAAVHAQGGVAIAAHPMSPAPSRFDDRAVAAIDGFEAASSNDAIADVAPFTQRATALRPSLAAIGASDFHNVAPLGLCRTFVFVIERSPAAVLDAIRRGRTVACDAVGETYGPADLVPSVAAECRRAAVSAAAGWNWTGRVSTAGAWLALAALVALGARERGLE